MKIKREELQIQGVPISRGIAIGKPFFISIIVRDFPEINIADEDIECEIERYRKVLLLSQLEVKRLKEQLELEGALEGATVLEAHLQMMQDPLLTQGVEQEIRKMKKNAESIFYNCIKKVEQKFKDIQDPFFRERFKDIQDIARRVMIHLQEGIRHSLSHLPDNSIVFASELSPSDTAEARIPGVGAFVTEIGGATSHAAIVAKAKGIPYVTGIDFSLVQGSACTDVIVDGRTGDIILNPSLETLTKYRGYQRQLENHFKFLRKTGFLEPKTYDGYSMKLSANIEMIHEVDKVHEYGGSGVGLFRSEFIFLARHNFPSEEDQLSIYRRAVEKMKGLPIVIRTFDTGGDKFPEHQPHQTISHSLLGSRTFRFMLKEQSIFKTQLRAILRASSYGNVSILFPMISSLTELLEAKALIEQAKSELRKEGIPFSSHVPVGCMIEVPSAAVITDMLAQESDFLSIGTNDLAQYALAVDRGVQALNSWEVPTHPSIVRLIKLIAQQASHQGVPVNVCGEIAADPRFTPLLIGLGVNELSVASRYLPIVKNAIRNISYVDAVVIAENALQMRTANEIQDLLTQEYQKSVPSDFLFNP